MRVPVLLWGDIIKGKSPITRRTLVGERAHECMYAWVYLTDFLAIRRLIEEYNKLKEENKDFNIVKNLDSNTWSNISRPKIDPHFQVKKDNFYIASLVNGLAKSSNQNAIDIVEFGQTFYTLIDKVELLNLINKTESPKLTWKGIDNSEFVNITANFLHKDKVIKIYEDWKKYEKSDFSILTSRFVISYAIPSSKELVKFISQNFNAIVIEDAFSTTEKDEQVFNHGQKQTFYNINYVIKELEELGYEIKVLSHYGDHPGGSRPCHIVKTLCVKKGIFNLSQAAEYVKEFGFSLDPIIFEKNNLLETLNSRITSLQWSQIKNNKKVNPVWDQTSFQKESLKNKLKNALRPFYYRLQILKNGLGSHDLRGTNMNESLIDYIHNEGKTE